MTIEGTIKKVDLEGGFYGIQGDDGKKYNPVNDLPESVRRDGLKVKAEVEPSFAMSVRMWGQTVEVLSVEPI